MAENPVCFNDIYVGMKLRDDDGHFCVVKKINPHDIVVKYTWGSVGGYGFIPMDSNSKTALYKF